MNLEFLVSDAQTLEEEKPLSEKESAGSVRRRVSQQLIIIRPF